MYVSDSKLSKVCKEIAAKYDVKRCDDIDDEGDEVSVEFAKKGMEAYDASVEFANKYPEFKFYARKNDEFLEIKYK